MTSVKKFLMIRCYKHVLVIKSVKISAGWTLIFQRNSNFTDLLAQKNCEKHSSFNADLPWMACGFVCMEYAMWAFQKPALPCYSETWDPKVVLLHLKTFPAILMICHWNMQLTLKLVMLMALLQRVQTLPSLCVEGMSPLSGEYFFLHLFYFNRNNWQRVPEQTFTIIFGKIIPKPL